MTQPDDTQTYGRTPLQERLGLEPSEEVTLDLLPGPPEAKMRWRATARIKDRDPASASAWRGVAGEGVTAEDALADLHERLRPVRIGRLSAHPREQAIHPETDPDPYGAGWWDNQINPHPPVNDAAHSAMDDVRSAFGELGHILLKRVPPGPDRTVALRSLKEASMHAIGAIACNQAHFLDDGEDDR